MKKFAFTLAEVLISLTIIGVIAAMTLPTVRQYGMEKQYYSAYKKAYTIGVDAIEYAIARGDYKPRTAKHDADGTTSAIDNFKAFSKYFGITKKCFSANNSSCWEHNGEQLQKGGQPGSDELAFVDSAGFVWSLYFNKENIILVDTNGKKGPNRYGKDRWYFVPADKNGIREGNGAGKTATLTPFYPYNEAGGFAISDITNKDTNWCNYPPCKIKTGLDVD